MTEIGYIVPKTLPPPLGHYSPAVCANGFVFVSGLLPMTPDGRKMTGEPFDLQARQVLNNLGEILRSSGTDPSKLVQVRVYLVNLENWPAFNQLYAAWLGDAKPARCVVPVTALHFGLELEVEAVAAQ